MAPYVVYDTISKKKPTNTGTWHNVLLFHQQLNFTNNDAECFNAIL